MFRLSNSIRYPLLTNLQKKGIKACAYDRPGFGFSPLPQTTHRASIEENSKNLNELLHSLGLVKKIIGIGHSLGASFALGYSQYYPQEVMGLILLDPISSESDLSNYNSAVSQYNFWTNVGISRLLSFISPRNIPQSKYHQQIQSISVSDILQQPYHWRKKLYLH